MSNYFSDIQLPLSRDAVTNLIREGISQDKIQLVGKTIIDSLEMLRENSERPSTVTHDANQLCGLHNLNRKTEEIFRRQAPRREKIEFWDGKAAEIIVEVLRKLNNGSDKRDSKKVEQRSVCS